MIEKTAVRIEGRRGPRQKQSISTRSILTPVSNEIVVGCVTEDTPKYLGQTLRLVQSIRWLRSELARSHVVVGAVESIDPRARRALEAYGADIRIVPRFEPRNGSANRLQLFSELRE